MSVFYPYLNIISMLFFGIYGSYTYIVSVLPAHYESKMGSVSYDYCSKKRKAARSLLSISTLNFLLYTIVPIDLPFMKLNIFDSFLTSTFVSLIFFLPGILVFVLGRKALGKESESTKKFRKITNTGIYSKIRHPQLLGEILFILFFAVFLNSAFLLAFSIVFWIPNYLIWMHYEEKDLVLRFGDDYISYMTTTKKIIPFIF